MFIVSLLGEKFLWQVGSSWMLKDYLVSDSFQTRLLNVDQTHAAFLQLLENKLIFPGRLLENKLLFPGSLLETSPKIIMCNVQKALYTLSNLPYLQVKKCQQTCHHQASLSTLFCLDQICNAGHWSVTKPACCWQVTGQYSVKQEVFLKPAKNS